MTLDREARPGYLNVIERATSVIDGYDHDLWGPGAVAEFTCDHCWRAPECVLAFDLYNTGGDCLASK